MNILEDGLINANDFPADVPELKGPPPKRKGFTWVPPPDALSREEYLRVGRPLLVAAGFLKDVEADDAPPLPRMPDTPRKTRAKKIAVPKPVPKPEDVVPF